MTVISFTNWPDTLDELAEGFVNRLIGYDIKYQDAIKIFSKIYLRRIGKEHSTRSRHLKGAEDETQVVGR